MTFLDTNIIIRYLTRDDPDKAQACYELFQRVKQGQERLCTTGTIIAEVVYVLTSPTLYGLNAQDICERLRPILSLTNLKLPQKNLYIRSLELYISYPTLDFEDVVSLAYMEQNKLRDIYSYDHHFNRVSTITRREPA